MRDRPGCPLELDFAACFYGRCGLCVRGPDVADYVGLCECVWSDEGVCEVAGGFPSCGDGGRSCVLVRRIIAVVAGC